MAPPATTTVRFHYHRPDGDYEDVTIYLWDAGGNGEGRPVEFRPTAEDDFGPLFEVDPSVASAGGTPDLVGFLFRLRGDWSTKEAGDRFWSPHLGNEVWVVGQDPAIYRDRPDVAPRIESAFLLNDKTLSVRLSHAVELGRLTPALFQLVCGNGTRRSPIGVRALAPSQGKARRAEILLEDCPPADRPLTLLADGYRPAEVTRRNPTADPDCFDCEEILGAVYTPSHTIFRVFSPTASNIAVHLYPTPTGNDDAGVSLPLSPKGNGLWEAVHWGDHHLKAYSIQVELPDGTLLPEVNDPYAVCTTGHDGRALIVDPRRYDPDGFRPLRRPPFSARPTDAIIYEAHIRDLTIHPSSGLTPDRRGKYIGLATRGTRLPATNLPTLLDHLVDLGITHLQLLPVQDFDNNESTDTYNWGYMTSCFFSPEGWYATNHRDPSRIAEFKQLVHACHEAGIRVVMDVVYNHTGEHATFENVAPGYYHRRRGDGTFWNGSGTGNEFRTEAPMARRFLLDCCRYWVEEYGIDGFRLDLMGLVDIDTLRALRRLLDELDPTLLLYGEPWAATGPDGAGVPTLVYKDVVTGNRIGAFNDHYRNALKGSPDGNDPGYIHDGSARDGVLEGLRGAIHDWAAEPTEAIQYADCHDNLILWDKHLAVNPDADEDTLVRWQALAAGLVLLSQGVPFLHAGVEIARTKQGNHNSYDAPDSINQVDWTRLTHFAPLHRFVRAVVALRRTHPLLRLHSRDQIDRHLLLREDLRPAPESITIEYDASGLYDERWARALLLVNPLANDLQASLPQGQWLVYVQGLNASAKPLFDVHGQVILPASGIVLLAREA